MLKGLKSKATKVLHRKEKDKEEEKEREKGKSRHEKTSVLCADATTTAASSSHCTQHDDDPAPSSAHESRKRSKYGCFKLERSHSTKSCSRKKGNDGVLATLAKASCGIMTVSAELSRSVNNRSHTVFQVPQEKDVQQFQFVQHHCQVPSLKLEDDRIQSAPISLAATPATPRQQYVDVLLKEKHFHVTSLRDPHKSTEWSESESAPERDDKVDPVLTVNPHNSSSCSAASPQILISYTDVSESYEAPEKVAHMQYSSESYVEVFPETVEGLIESIHCVSTSCMEVTSQNRIMTGDAVKAESFSLLQPQTIFQSSTDQCSWNADSAIHDTTNDWARQVQDTFLCKTSSDVIETSQMLSNDAEAIRHECDHPDSISPVDNTKNGAEFSSYVEDQIDSPVPHTSPGILEHPSSTLNSDFIIPTPRHDSAESHLDPNIITVPDPSNSTFTDSVHHSSITAPPYSDELNQTNFLPSEPHPTLQTYTDGDDSTPSQMDRIDFQCNTTELFPPTFVESGCNTSTSCCTTLEPRRPIMVDASCNTSEPDPQEFLHSSSSGDKKLLSSCGIQTDDSIQGAPEAGNNENTLETSLNVCLTSLDADPVPDIPHDSVTPPSEEDNSNPSLEFIKAHDFGFTEEEAISLDQSRTVESSFRRPTLDSSSYGLLHSHASDFDELASNASSAQEAVLNSKVDVDESMTSGKGTSHASSLSSTSLFSSIYNLFRRSKVSQSPMLCQMSRKKMASTSDAMSCADPRQFKCVETQSTSGSLDEVMSDSIVVVARRANQKVESVSTADVNYPLWRVLTDMFLMRDPTSSPPTSPAADAAEKSFSPSTFSKPENEKNKKSEQEDQQPLLRMTTKVLSLPQDLAYWLQRRMVFILSRSSSVLWHEFRDAGEDKDARDPRKSSDTMSQCNYDVSASIQSATFHQPLLRRRVVVTGLFLMATAIAPYYERLCNSAYSNLLDFLQSQVDFSVGSDGHHPSISPPAFASPIPLSGFSFTRSAPQSPVSTPPLNRRYAFLSPLMLRKGFAPRKTDLS